MQLLLPSLPAPPAAVIASSLDAATTISRAASAAASYAAAVGSPPATQHRANRPSPLRCRYRQHSLARANCSQCRYECVLTSRGNPATPPPLRRTPPAHKHVPAPIHLPFNPLSPPLGALSARYSLSLLLLPHRPMVGHECALYPVPYDPCNHIGSQVVCRGS